MNLEIADADKQKQIDDYLTQLEEHLKTVMKTLEYAQELETVAWQVCGKEMEIDGITFRQQELIERLRAVLVKGKAK